MRVLYLSSVLPKRSETFVYREILGLQALGVDIGVASLYPPERDLGEEALDRLAAGAVTVYGAGHVHLLRDALRYFLRHPIRSAVVMATATTDALMASDLKLRDRPKVVFQGLAALALAWRLSWHGHPAHAKISDTGRMPVLQGSNYTHIHIHMAHAATTVGMYAAKALGIPFSFTGHAADLFRERCLLEQKLRRAAFVACISNWHRDWYRTICNRPDRDYPVIRCGVDVPEAPLPARSKPPLTLLGLGRLVPKKGFDILIKACRILADKGIALECTIAGDGPELERLQSLANGLPIKFPGAIAHRDVPALSEAVDVFVLPCQISRDGDRDGIPVVLMEAMARGICAVSGDLPTIRELISDTTNGCLVNPGDPEALATCLDLLAAQPGLRSALAAAGRKTIQEEFSSAKNLDKLLVALTALHQP
jgi:glycosyltransferase involved in cell wall biosynthesis